MTTTTAAAARPGTGTAARLADLRATVDIARRTTAYRLGIWYLGRIRHRPLARLLLAEGRRDPYPLYDQIRARGPFAPGGSGLLVTARHGTADAILRDRRFGVQAPGTPYEPRPGRHTPALGETWDLGLLALDPPDHTRLRRLAAPAFTARRVEAYRPLIERVTRRLIGRALERGRDGFDLMADLATPLPILVIAELLGLPETDVPRLHRYGNALALSLDGIKGVGHARELRRTLLDLQDLFGALIEERRREPGEDVVSRLVTALGEDRLTPGELLQTCTLLLAAGFETTVNLIGNGVRALIAHPDQWALLRADPGLAPRVVEETLRYDSPVQLTSRTAHEDVEVSGRRIARGREVLLLLGGAGRDPDVFVEPERFDVTRQQRAEHLAFSGGAHYCLGAALARLEGAVVFGALAERVPGFELAGRGRRRRTVTLRGFASLPVRLTAHP